MDQSPFDPDEQNINLADKIVVALERISEAFRVLLWEESTKHGLSPIQVQILLFVKTHSPQSLQGELLGKRI